VLVDAASGLAAVRADVEGACESLVLATPEALTCCEGALERAAETLRRGRTAWDWKSAGEAARIEAAQLQAGIRRAGRLLSSASRYHAGWLRILSAMTSGYSARGDSAPMAGMRRISLEG
jgi:hypothetical protein